MRLFKTITAFFLTVSMLATGVPASANQDMPAEESIIHFEEASVLSDDLDKTIDSDSPVQANYEEEDDGENAEEAVGAESGTIMIIGGVEGKDYTRAEDGTITVQTSTPLVLDGKGRLITKEWIVLGIDSEDAQDIHVTIKNLKLRTENNAPIKIIDHFKKDVYITIEGENELICIGDPEGGFAGIEKNSVPEDGTLIIDGTGSLSTTGGASAPGIGSQESTANIVINAGTIIASTSRVSDVVVGNYSSAPGIGAGGRNESVNGASNITINGGNVSVHIDSYGAAIGGGYGKNAENITINGGIVSASSIYGAGIGGGQEGTGSNIAINGGTVHAWTIEPPDLGAQFGGNSGAGIGGGFGGNGESISITGGTVYAESYQGEFEGGAGIGGGCNGNGNNITISGGTVYANANLYNAYGAGIGGGARYSGESKGNGSNITISGGTVTAHGGAHGIGIGGGWGRYIDDEVEEVNYGETKNVVIRNASVKTDGSGFLDKVNGNTVYKLSVPHYGESSVFYKLSSAKIWTELSFPSFHEDDEQYYIWLPEGVYDIKAGTHEWDSVSLPDAEQKVNTRKIVIDAMLGSELEIISEDSYRVNDIEYDCSAATDKYVIEQVSKDPLKGKHIIISDVSEVTIKNLNVHSVRDHAALLVNTKTDLTVTSEGINTFTSPSDHAGIEKGSDTGKLVFNGQGKITATGGEKGAGIGGGDLENGEKIFINSGTIIALGGENAAGIGGGSYGDGKQITVSGGSVYATGSLKGADIGGGAGGDGTEIAVNGGTVICGSAGGIGAGNGGGDSSIFIGGGSIKTEKMGSKPLISASDKRTLTLKRLSGYIPGEQPPFSSIKGAEYYVLDDVAADDDGCFYFYLPDGVDISAYMKCLVTFVSNCSMEVAPQSLYVGDKVTMPVGIKNPGYHLEGWYTSNEDYSDENRWDFETDTVTGDITLYARWVTGSGEDPLVEPDPSDPDKELTADEDGTYKYTLVMGEQYKINIPGIDLSSLNTNDKKTVAVTNKGFAKGKSVGSTDVTCVVNGKTVIVHFTVVYPVISAVKNCIVVGESLPVSIKGTGIQNITWKVNNSKAEISEDGMLTGKAVGSVKLTATIHKKNYTVSFKVEEPKFKQPSYTIKAGKAVKIKMTGTKQGMCVSYVIDDETVAAMTPDGKVAGLKAGTTTLTATLAGEEYVTQIRVE